MASFGAAKLSECRWKPGGFTRLTPEVLIWVKNVTGIEDPGEMIMVQHFFLTNHIISAVLISEGNDDAEIYHPDRDSPCVLPNIPDRRYYHTYRSQAQDGSLMCGGYKTPISCRRWNDTTLLERR